MSLAMGGISLGATSSLHCYWTLFSFLVLDYLKYIFPAFGSYSHPGPLKCRSFCVTLLTSLHNSPGPLPLSFPMFGYFLPGASSWLIHIDPWSYRMVFVVRLSLPIVRRMRFVLKVTGVLQIALERTFVFKNLVDPPSYWMMFVWISLAVTGVLQISLEHTILF